MVSEITLTIDDSGNYVIKGQIAVITDNKIDMLKWVNEFAKDLGYFPTNPNDLIINPIGLEEFLKHKRKTKK